MIIVLCTKFKFLSAIHHQDQELWDQDSQIGHVDYQVFILLNSSKSRIALSRRLNKRKYLSNQFMFSLTYL